MYPTCPFVHLPSSELYFDMMSVILEANQDIEVTLKMGVMSQNEGGGLPHYHGVALPALDYLPTNLHHCYEKSLLLIAKLISTCYV